MRAAVSDRYGPPDVVRLEDVDQPAPVDDQVLVRVARRVGQPRRSRRPLPQAPVRAPVHGPARAAQPPRSASMWPAWSRRSGRTPPGSSPGDAGVRRPVPGRRSARSRSTSAPASGRSSRSRRAVRSRRRRRCRTAAILALQGLRLRNGRTPGPGDRVLDRRGVGQRRAVRSSRSRSRLRRGGHRRSLGARSSTSSARSAPTTSSTTRRSTTRRPATATTGSSTPMRTTRCCACGGRSSPAASTSRWAARPRLIEALARGARCIARQRQARWA